MNLLAKLDYLMKERGMNKRNLSIQSGIPYTTIDSLYKNGAENIKLSTLKRFADFFEITLDEIADDSIDITNKESNQYYIDKNTAEYAEVLKNNTGMRQLFDAAMDVSEDDLKIAVEMIKRMRR